MTTTTTRKKPADRKPRTSANAARVAEAKGVRDSTAVEYKGCTFHVKRDEFTIGEFEDMEEGRVVGVLKGRLADPEEFAQARAWSIHDIDGLMQVILEASGFEK